MYETTPFMPVMQDIWWTVQYLSVSHYVLMYTYNHHAYLLFMLFLIFLSSILGLLLRKPHIQQTALVWFDLDPHNMADLQADE